MKKILSIIAALIIIAIVGLTVFIKLYITPERVKVFLILQAEKNLNRKVVIEELNISLFKGIVVKDFAIKEADGKTDFLKSKVFVLKYKFLPLLSKKVIIDELRIVSPEIRIVRNKEGKFNFEGIGKKKPDQVKEEKEEEKAEEAEGLPISLLVSKLIIDDAVFSLIDNKKELPDIKGSFNINAGIESAGKDELISEGSIDLRLDAVVIKKSTGKQLRNISAGLKYGVIVNLKSNSIRINKADIKVQKIPVSITGDVTNIKTAPEIDIAVSIPKIKIADILESVALFVDTKGISLSGNLMADLKVRGMPMKLDTLKTDGRINLEKVGITYNDISAVLDGNLKFKEQSLEIDLKSTIGKNTAELKGTVSSYFKNQDIKLNLYSKKLILDELIPAGKTKSSTPAKKEKLSPKKAKSEEAKPLDLRISADGEIKIDTAIYKGMSMNNFYTKFQLKNNRFEISKMTALVGKGKFNLKSLVDLSKPGYTYNLSINLDSLHVDEVVNTIFPKAKDTVFGVLSINLKLNGAGTLPENIKKNLIGNGNFKIKDGKITNSKIPETLADFLGIEELRTIKLKQAKGTVKIKAGIVKLNSIFSSDEISMNPSGKIGLDETLDLAFDLKLSSRLTDKATLNSSIASYIKDEEGWGVIPLKVSGTFSDPSYGVDVARAGKRVIKKKAEELIEDIFDKDKDKKEKKKDKKKRDRKPLEDIFKGLF